MIFPENEPNRGDVKPPISEERKVVRVPLRAEQNPEDRGGVKKSRNGELSPPKKAHVGGKSDQLDGIRFERASPGDKSLA